MAKIYYLKRFYSSEFDGSFVEPICLSTNKKQLDNIAKRLNRLNGHEYYVEVALDYKPYNISKIFFVIKSNSDFNFYYSDIHEIVKENVFEHYLLPKDNEELQYSILSLNFKNSLSHKDIDLIMKTECPDYKERERDFNLQFKAKYWQSNPSFY